MNHLSIHITPRDGMKTEHILLYVHVVVIDAKNILASALRN